MANENANAMENQSDTQLDFDEIEKALEEKLHQHEAELGFLEEEVKQIGDPEALGTVLLDTVWEQFTNQIAIQAGEDFIRDNNGLRLDLSKDAHEQTTDNFEQGKIATHNTKIDYQKRYDEYKADLQTDPDAQVDIQKNMRYNEETKTYERYDKSTGTWVGKKRYNERLKVWEEFDPRSGEWKKNLAKDARKNFDIVVEERIHLLVHIRESKLLCSMKASCSHRGWQLVHIDGANEGSVSPVGSAEGKRPEFVSAKGRAESAPRTPSDH